MKKFNLSLVAILAMSTFAVAGGDIAPVEEPVVVVPEVVEELSTGAFYLGAAYGLLKSDSNFFDTSVANQTFDMNSDYSALMLQAGYKFNDYVAVEGRYWIGLSDEAFTNPLNHNVLDDFDHNAEAWGVYVKPMYPVTDALDIYALLGYAQATATGITLGNTNHDFDIDGFSWGVGVAYSFTDSLAVFVDYVDFQDDDIALNTADHTVDGTFEHAFDSINFGLTYQF